MSELNMHIKYNIQQILELWMLKWNDEFFSNLDTGTVPVLFVNTHGKEFKITIQIEKEGDNDEG